MEGSKKSFFIIAVVFSMAFVFFFCEKACARVNLYAPSVDILEEQTWTLENSPYVISGNDWLDVKARLTIEPGVVVKFVPSRNNNRYPGIRVSGGGKIIANGNEDLKIVFTSYYDDENGGDTNGDGGLSSPARGDWRGIIFDSDQSELSHVKIYYGANIYQSYGSVEFKNSSSARISDSEISYCAGSCVRLNEPSNPSFLSVLISKSSDFGIYSTIAGSAPVFSNISIAECDDGMATLNVGNTLEFENVSLDKSYNIEFEGNSVSANALWPAIDGVYYVLRGRIKILNDAVLTIGSGAVIKGAGGQYPGSRIEVYGKLIAKSDAQNPIIFTSFSDDPKQGDWGGIYFSDSSGSEFDNVKIEYGGRFFADFSGVVYATVDYNMLHFKNSSANISNSTIGNAKNAITLEGASSVYISDSVITTTRVGLLSLSSSESFVTRSSFENIVSKGIENYGAQIDARNNWWGDNSGPTHANNPEGVGASCLGDLLFDPWRVVLDPVILVPGILGSWKVAGKWELDPILNTYDNLWEALINSGYVVGENLFAFPYDWRLSNVYTAGLLKEKIDEIKSISKSSKVDIIAHSMGGLVARAYVELLDYENDIDQLIFLGTPHKGSTRAYFTWEAGEIGPDRRDKIRKNILLLDALKSGYSSVFSYVRDMPMESVKELLPIYNYLNKNGLDLEYPNNYPQNTFLNLLNNESELADLNNLNEIINIRAETGDNNTITSLRVIDYLGDDNKWEHGYPENFNLVPFTGDGIVYDDGDLTVPSISNSSFFGLDDVVIDSNHSDMVTDAQKRIIKELTGIEPEQEIRKNMFTNWLMVRIFSPVDFQVIAPGGSIIGKDFENNTIINQIDGAFYSGFDTDVEFAVIPNPDDGEYEVVLQGTGSGEYEVITDYITDTEEISHQAKGQTEKNQQIEYTLTYSQNNAEEMSITAQDTSPPITSIRIVGTSLGNNIYQESATIFLSASDETGICKTEYSLDSGITWQEYSSEIVLNEIGSFEFLYRSVDNVLNTENANSVLIKIQAKQSSGVVPLYIFQSPRSNGAVEDIQSKEDIKPKVLGERAIHEPTYYVDEDILSALSGADFGILLDYLGRIKDIDFEKTIQKRFSDFALSESAIMFVAYGTKSTQSLGAGERAGILYSYKRAYGNLPKNNDDWMDVLNIAAGRAPEKRNKVAEQNARNIFYEIFGRNPNLKQNDDNYVIMEIAYGLRPKHRDIEKEIVGIEKFIKIYGVLPSSSSDWDVVRCLSY